jgi:hypothetical protein
LDLFRAEIAITRNPEKLKAKSAMVNAPVSARQLDGLILHPIGDAWVIIGAVKIGALTAGTANNPAREQEWRYLFKSIAAEVRLAATAKRNPDIIAPMRISSAS